MIRQAVISLLEYLRTPAARSSVEFGNAIEDEISFHLAERTDENIARGMSPEAAKKAALALFGDASKIAAQCHRDAVQGLAVWHRLHLCVTILLVLGLVRLWTTAPKAGLDAHSTRVSSLPPGIASMLDNDWTGDVMGQIVDDHERPIQRARVLVTVKTWPDGSYFQRAYHTITGPDGKFSISDVYPINDIYEVQVAVIAQNHVLKSSYHGDQHGVLPSFTIRLEPAPNFQLRVQSERGEPLAGVEILPRQRVDLGGAKHQIFFDSGQLVITKTDDDGRVNLPYFLPGDTVMLMLRRGTSDWVVRDFQVPLDGQTITIHLSEQPVNHSEES